MTPIIINITLGLEKQDLSMVVPANNQLKATNINFGNYQLNPFYEAELIAQINRLIKKSIQKSTVFEQNYLPQQNNINKADKQWLQKVAGILSSEMSDSKFTVDDLAAILKVSRSKVHRRIKRITGLTPNKYFRIIKLEAARKILEKGNAQTVSEVCYAVGFDTPKYFSKIYEQQFGKRPISYVRAN